MIGLAVGDFFAISPAIIGALVTVPVYFIGRVLFNWRVGLIAASLIAILPGGFMRRTLLGFSDHHALEVLLTTTAILFLILAMKHAQREGLSFIDLAQRDWRKLARPLIYALLAGIALGLYLLTWTGGLLFVFIIALYAVVQYIADHLRGRSTDYLLVTIGVCFFITLLVILPFVNLRIIDALHIGFVVAAIVGLGALSGVSRIMDARGIRRAYYPAVLAGLGGLGLSFPWLPPPRLSLLCPLPPGYFRRRLP
jgi:dolichyl-diphosphooligosaccharide--protein glycosyltransferase